MTSAQDGPQRVLDAGVAEREPEALGLRRYGALAAEEKRIGHLAEHEFQRERWSGEERRATISTVHPAARFGIPVVIVNGEPLDALQAAARGFLLVSATPSERTLLERGGFNLPEE